MTSLYQFTYEPSATYRYDGTVQSINVTHGPKDADFSRFAMAHDGTTSHLFCFQGRSRDTIYRYGFDGKSYSFGHGTTAYNFVLPSKPDGDESSFDCVHDGNSFKFFLRRLGNPSMVYQFSRDGTIGWYTGTLGISGFPNNSDRWRWMTLHDGKLRYYALNHEGAGKMHQGVYVGGSFRYGALNSIQDFTIAGAPSDTNFNNASVLFDGSKYRLYFMKAYHLSINY